MFSLANIAIIFINFAKSDLYIKLI